MAKDKTPDETPGEPARQRKPGPLTMITTATDIAEAKAEKRRKEEIARDREQDKGKDKWANLAHETAINRAKVAEAQVDKLNEMNASLHKRYGGTIALLIVAIIGLAGYRVAGNLLKGEINIGDQSEQTAPKD